MILLGQVIVWSCHSFLSWYNKNELKLIHIIIEARKHLTNTENNVIIDQEVTAITYASVMYKKFAIDNSQLEDDITIINRLLM